MKWLTRLFLSHDIGNAVALARYYHRLGMACSRRSTEQHDAWSVAANMHYAVSNAHMNEARTLAELPRKPRVSFHGVPVHFDRRMR